MFVGKEEEESSCFQCRANHDVGRFRLNCVVRQG
jgi:hypothetical protein